MSILIKGMEIPDKCGHCRFATAFECQVTKNFITTFNVRQVDCPLVPAPPVLEGEEVYGQYADTAGNFHWSGTHSGEHMIKAEEGE